MPGDKSDYLAGDTGWEEEALRLHGEKARPGFPGPSIRMTLASAAIWRQAHEGPYAPAAEEPPGQPRTEREKNGCYSFKLLIWRVVH